MQGKPTAKVIIMDESRPKTLPPSLRTKGRYIVFEILSENPVEYKDFTDALWNSLTSFLGEVGTADSQVRVLRNLYDSKSQRGVIRCGHDMVEHVRTGLSLISMIGESRVVIKVSGVTGTIKSARNKYLGMRDLRSYK